MPKTMLRSKKHIGESKTGAEALLAALWFKYGGPAELKRRYFPDFHVQSFVNWRVRGRVPLEITGLISSKLSIPIWGLNYEELSIMFPLEIPTWKDVVKSYNLGKKTEDIILFLKPPFRWIDN